MLNKGLSISIRYALKLQMSPTSTLRATQMGLIPDLSVGDAEAQ